MRNTFDTTLLLVSLIVLCSGCGSNQSRSWDVLTGKEVLEREGRMAGLGDPERFIVRGDTVMYLVDRALNGLHRYDLRTGALSEGTGLGRGPGEVAQSGRSYLAPYGRDNDQVWLHDTGLQRITIYSLSLEPVRQMTITGSMRSLPLGDSLMANVPFGRVGIVDVRRISRRIEGANLTDALWTYRAKKREAFEVVPNNFVLKYGPIASCGETIVSGFDFASYVLRIRESGGDLLKGAPEEIFFPPPDPDLPPERARLPTWFNPRATLDLACDEKHIYALFSGESVSRARARSLDLAGRLTEAKRAELSASVRRSDRLHVYDRATGSFVHEVRLPIEARQITATENKLYLLVHEEEGPVILQYAWTEDYQ